MKLLICSDIHGDIECMNKILEIFNSEGYDRLVILGDILYHGPRNDLPPSYAPKQVIEALNAVSDRIIAVRGNCDAEVDGMVLDFPIMADYAILELDGNQIFATHGHHFNMENVPNIAPGTVLLHGHTHVTKVVEFGEDNLYINPGSVSLPKEGNPKTLMIYEDSHFTLLDLDKNVLLITNI